MARIIVLGAGGMLGHKLCQMLSPCHRVVALTRRPAEFYRRFEGVYDGVESFAQGDVLSPGCLERVLDETEPEVIVNCVGIIKQLEEAKNRYLSVAINSYLPHELARLAAARGARLIHFSTDCVFSGEKGGYTESDESDAKDLYGKSKYLGETDASETAALTIRGSIVGRELTEPTSGLIEWFLSRRGGRVRGFSRAIYTGFSTQEMARIVDMAIREYPDLRGVYQVASRAISKYDLLCLANAVWKADVDIDRDETVAIDRGLTMDRFAAATGYRPPEWEAMLREMHEDPTLYDVWHGRAC